MAFSAADYRAGFRALISGQRRGAQAALLRGLLRAAEMPYTAAVQWRNRQYDRGHKPIERVDVPVISVGNLTLGGTGKTPLVAWLARWFRQRGVRVTIISRGYGAEAGAQNDEALELEQTLPDVPHVQNPDRVAAAKMAIEEFDCQLILLDDAFQHRRIHRDLNIVVVDALEPFGFGHVFPRGALREPLAGLRRSDVVVLSRADLVEPLERERIRSTVAQYAPAAIWLEASHQPEKLLSASGREEALSALAGQPVAAFCGIGNPAGFRQYASGGHGLPARRNAGICGSFRLPAIRRRILVAMGRRAADPSRRVHTQRSREIRCRAIRSAPAVGCRSSGLAIATGQAELESASKRPATPHSNSVTR